ncbi:hypothetical protein AB0C59_01895 [Streptomyces sp. NPDC048664]|uniref:hypothetical protein n=1 Tax=Streptomyces sp. NPDC048664 TaxID=3154505 RepID=UPI003448AC18
MNKLTRRIATVGAFAAFAGGTFLATGGDAVAATPVAVAAPGPARATPTDPWIADQLRAADPWILDQLASLDHRSR